MSQHANRHADHGRLHPIPGIGNRTTSTNRGCTGGNRNFILRDDPHFFMAGIDSTMISKIARSISAPESNVHYMHDACNYVIFFDPESYDGAIGPGSSAGSAPRAQRALPALLLALGSA